MKRVLSFRGSARGIGYILAAALMVTADGVRAVDASPRTVSAVHARVSAAMTGLVRFKTTGSLDELERASHGLRASIYYSELIALSAPEALTLRRQYVANYTQLLSTIEGIEDPAFSAFDHGYSPLICITPPREPNGHQAQPCAEPSEISDPPTRAAYISDLARNAERTKQINLQRRLRYIDDMMAEELKLVLRQFRGRAPDDSAALDAIVNKASIRESRKSAIRAMY